MLNDTHYTENIIDMKKMNISFIDIDETIAVEILSSEINYSKLMSYTVLFEKYKKSSKCGQFIELDFAQLYNLSKLDRYLRQLILIMALDIEQSLKVRFLNDYYSFNLSDINPVEEFWMANNDYLNERYRKENFSSNIQPFITRCEGELKSLPIEDFFEVIQFGTFQKFAQFFYSSCCYETQNSKIYNLFSKQLNGILVLRNIAAHNNPLLPFLIEPYLLSTAPYRDYSTLSFLGSKGIKNRTLNTNMKKPLIHDFLMMLHVAYKILPDYQFDNILSLIYVFLMDYCKSYMADYQNNLSLVSAYRFIHSTYQIYKKLGKHLTN